MCLSQVGYVPIPRIEYTDDSLDIVIENLALSGRNLFPNIVSVEAHNFIKFSPYNAIKDDSSHDFTLTFAQIQADMKDVAFYFRKKTGLPKVETGPDGTKRGGICVVGWSLASFYMKALFAYLEEYDGAAVPELEPYMRDVIMFGAYGVSLP